MRILLVNKFIFPKGGAETYTFDVGKMLEEHGHEVQYFGLENEKNIVGNAKHQDKGYTANLGFRLHRSDGSAVEKLHTAWTHKGRKFLYHELKRRGILPMAEQES